MAYSTLLIWSTISIRNTSAEYKLSDEHYGIPFAVLIFLTLIDLCIFFIGFVGNIITCIVIIGNKSMHTTTNCYLLNLAISDLLLLIVGVPYDIYDNWNPYKYHLGIVGCYLHCCISEISNNVSILTITAFTLERYLAICHPFAMHGVSNLSRTIKYIIAIWIVAVICACVIAMQKRIVSLGDESTCLFDLTRRDLPYSLEITTVITFVIPVTIITISYILIGISLVKSRKMVAFKNKRINKEDGIAIDCKSQRIDNSTNRVLKMLVVIVAAFFICWLPFYINRLIFVVYAPKIIAAYSHDDLITMTLIILYFVTILYFMSAAINPIIYNVMSNKFRDAIKELVLKSKRTSWLVNQPESSNTVIESINTFNFKSINTNA